MTAAHQDSYTPAMPHDPPVEVFPDAFMVRGSYRANRLMKFSRNMVLVRHGGLLLTCDCLQHYADRRFNSLFANIVMPLMGFPLRMLVGPLWLKAMTPEGKSLKEDFARIGQLNFDHLIAGHGSICQGGAQEKARSAIAKAFA